MVRLADARPAERGRARSRGETMAEDLDRDELIVLLERLGDAEDSDALAAAREIHMRVTAAGESWDELLLPLEADQDQAPDTSLEQPDTESEPATAVDDAQSLALIDKILAKRDIGDTTREELLGYKEDIAHGEFDLSDRKYLQALDARISKRR